MGRWERERGRETIVSKKTEKGESVHVTMGATEGVRKEQIGPYRPHASFFQRSRARMRFPNGPFEQLKNKNVRLKIAFSFGTVGKKRHGGDSGFFQTGPYRSHASFSNGPERECDFQTDICFKHVFERSVWESHYRSGPLEKLA